MLKRRIYVASSWRNEHQQGVVATLRCMGHEVYDFKNPPNRTGFSWSQCHDGITEAFSENTISGYLKAVETDVALAGFGSDKAALDWCDTCILVLPCGRSAHLEAGYTAGQGKDTYFLLHPDKFEPELMYLLGNGSSPDLNDIMKWMNDRQPGSVMRWHQHNGGSFKRPANHAIRLLREVVELCFAAGAETPAIFEALYEEIQKEIKKPCAPTDLNARAMELADCAILLELFAEYSGVNLNHEKRLKLDVLWTRLMWKADDGGALYRP